MAFGESISSKELIGWIGFLATALFFFCVGWLLGDAVRRKAWRAGWRAVNTKRRRKMSLMKCAVLVMALVMPALALSPSGISGGLTYQSYESNGGGLFPWSVSLLVCTANSDATALSATAFVDDLAIPLGVAATADQSGANGSLACPIGQRGAWFLFVGHPMSTVTKLVVQELHPIHTTEIP